MNIISQIVIAGVILFISYSHIIRSIIFYERGLFSIIYTIIFALWFALYLFIFVRGRVQRHLRAILEYNKEFGFDHQFKQNQDLIKYTKRLLLFGLTSILSIQILTHYYFKVREKKSNLYSDVLKGTKYIYYNLDHPKYI